MNERIKELAEQAGLLGPSSRVGKAHEATEKFAELIVKACADAAAIAAGEEALARPERLAELGWQEIECPICGGGARAFPKPEQEPLAWVTQVGTLVQVGMTNLKTGLMYGWTPLYTTPPKREWVGLTDEQLLVLEGTTTCTGNESWLRNLTRNIEAKLKEKNA